MATPVLMVTALISLETSTVNVMMMPMDIFAREVLRNKQVYCDYTFE